MPQNRLDIPVFYGTFANLTKLDLSFINAKIVLHKGNHFRNFFKTLLHPDVFQYSYSSAVYDYENYPIYEGNKIKRYAIIPIDYRKPFLEEHWHHFYQMMLSIYPSDFALIEIIHLDPYNGKFQCGGKSYYDFNTSGDGTFDHFMFIAPQEYRFVRNYLKQYFYSSLRLNYLKYILSMYSNSFKEISPTYQYISLIICLEVIVEGKEQLTYKLRRNTALLCGETIESCKRIYKNVDQLYKLRSAIVHGAIKPSYKNFKEYHAYLKKLVARLIRELIVHNIPTIEELNEKLTVLGYGQNEKLSKKYVPSRYPIVDNIHLSFQAIQKYS